MGYSDEDGPTGRWWWVTVVGIVATLALIGSLVVTWSR